MPKFQKLTAAASAAGLGLALLAVSPAHAADAVIDDDSSTLVELHNQTMSTTAPIGLTSSGTQSVTALVDVHITSLNYYLPPADPQFDYVYGPGCPEGFGPSLLLAGETCEISWTFHPDTHLSTGPQWSFRVQAADGTGDAVDEYLRVEMTSTLLTLSEGPDFGDQTYGHAAVRQLTVTNESAVEGTLELITSYWPFIVDLPAPLTVPAGESRTIDVGYTPSDLTSSTGFVIFQQRAPDGSGGGLTSRPSGRGATGVVTFEGGPIDFGTHDADAETSRDFTVTNTGDQPAVLVIPDDTRDTLAARGVQISGDNVYVQPGESATLSATWLASVPLDESLHIDGIVGTAPDDSWNYRPVADVTLLLIQVTGEITSSTPAPDPTPLPDPSPLPVDGSASAPSGSSLAQTGQAPAGLLFPLVLGALLLAAGLTMRLRRHVKRDH